MKTGMVVSIIICTSVICIFTIFVIIPIFGFLLKLIYKTSKAALPPKNIFKNEYLENYKVGMIASLLISSVVLVITGGILKLW